jgi:hypothetical protein
LLIVGVCLWEASVCRRLYVATRIKSLAWYQGVFAMFALASTLAVCADLVIGGLSGEALLRAYSTWVPLGIGALLAAIAMVTVAMWYALYREYDDFMDLLRGQATPDRPNLPRTIHVLLGGHIPEDVTLSHEVSATPVRWWGVVAGLVPIGSAFVAAEIGPATHEALHGRYPAPLAFLHPLAWASVLAIVAWGLTLILGAFFYGGPRAEAWDEILDEVLV